jgi:hypothetical protein
MPDTFTFEDALKSPQSPDSFSFEDALGDKISTLASDSSFNPIQHAIDNPNDFDTAYQVFKAKRTQPITSQDAVKFGKAIPAAVKGLAGGIGTALGDASVVAQSELPKLARSYNVQEQPDGTFTEPTINLDQDAGTKRAYAEGLGILQNAGVSLGEDAMKVGDKIIHPIRYATQTQDDQTSHPIYEKMPDVDPDSAVDLVSGLAAMSGYVPHRKQIGTTPAQPAPKAIDSGEDEASDREYFRNLVAMEAEKQATAKGQTLETLGGAIQAGEDPEKLKQEGAVTINPEDVSNAAGAINPELFIPLGAPGEVTNAVAGNILKYGGKALEVPADAVIAGVKKLPLAGKIAAGGATALGAYEAGKYLYNHPDQAAIGGGLLAAGGVGKLAGKLANEAGEQLLNPKFIAPESAAAIKEAANGGGFLNPQMNLASAKQAVRSGLQGAATGAVSMAPLNALTSDNASEFAEKEGGAAGIGILGGFVRNSEDGSYLRMKNQLNNILTQEGAQKQFGVGYDDAHASGVQNLDPASQDVVNKYRAFFGRLRTQDGTPYQIYAIKGDDYKQALSNNGVEGVGENSNGFVSPDGSQVFLNTDAMNADAGNTAGHEGAHIVEELSKRIAPELTQGLTRELHTNLYDQKGNPTEDFQNFLDTYNKSLGADVLATNDPQSRQKAESEFLAETGRKILSGGNIEQFGLPKTLTQKVRDAASQFLQENLGIQPENGQLGFGGQEIASITRGMSDLLFRAGKESIGNPATEEGANFRLQQLDSQISEPLPPNATPEQISARNDLIKERQGLVRNMSQAKMFERQPEPNLERPQTPGAPVQPDLSQQPEQPESTQVTHGVTPEMRQDFIERYTNQLQPVGKKRGTVRSTKEKMQEGTGIIDSYIEALHDEGRQEHPDTLFGNAIRFADSGEIPRTAGYSGEQPISPTDTGIGPIVPGTDTAGVAPTQKAEVAATEEAPKPQETGAVDLSKPVETGEKPISGPTLEPKPLSEDQVTKIAVDSTKGYQPGRKGQETVRKELAKITRDAVMEAHSKALPSDTDLVTMRTNRDGTKSISGTRFDFDDPAHQRILQQAGLTRAQIDQIRQIQESDGPLNVVYDSAKRLDSDQTNLSRQEAQAESTPDQRAIGRGESELANKSLVRPYFQVTNTGNIIVKGWSVDKMIGNAIKTIDMMNRVGGAPWESVNDPEFTQDFNAYVDNQRHGYTGQGDRKLTGTEAIPVQVDPNYRPIDIGKEKADFFNFIQGNEGAKSRTDRGQEFRDFASLNQNQPIAGEVNPLRKAMNELGLVSKGKAEGSRQVIEPTPEEIRADLIHEVSSDQGEAFRSQDQYMGDKADLSRTGVPRSDLVAAGFMPNEANPGEEVADKTKTPEFKKWFGASRVLDESGRPRVMYHGSPHGEFNKFSARKRGTGADNGGVGDYGNGFYFTPNMEDAIGYSKGANGDSPNAKVYSVYLRMEKPFDMKMLSDFDHYHNELVSKYGLFNIPDSEYNALYSKLGASEDDINFMREIQGDMGDDYWGDYDMAKVLKKKGFDGIINPTGDEYVVFNPTQIKSTENNGQFSRRNSDIRFMPNDVSAPDLSAADRQKAFKADMMAQRGFFQQKMKEGGYSELTDVPSETLAQWSREWRDAHPRVDQNGRVLFMPSDSRNQEDYRMAHRPMMDEGGASRLHDLSKSFGADIYTKNALQFFGSGDPREKNVLRILNSIRGKPDADVTIYRGIPKGVDGDISPGDWVTLDKSVAKDYGDQVLSKTVKAKDVTSWADSLLEFGYYPETRSSTPDLSEGSNSR